MAERAEPDIPQRPAESAKADVPLDAETPEIPPAMLDVHAPQEILHTWKGFSIHIATIVVGLFIAVALEQSVEAINRHSEVAALREDLHQESRQILADANNSETAHLYEVRWLTTRIAQAQLAIRERHPIGPRATNDMPKYASPDIPIWRSAKAAGRTSLLTKGEVNAYAEIDYVQAHLEEMEVVKNTARYAVKSFNHTYLGLLTTAYEAIDAYIHWLRILIGAENAIIDGRISLNEIYASERKTGGGDFFQNFM
jgi:hypothetical protein